MAGRQARAVTVLRAALHRAVRSRAVHRLLTVAGLCAVGWLIGGAGQASAAEIAPVDTASQTVNAVLRVANDALPVDVQVKAEAPKPGVHESQENKRKSSWTPRPGKKAVAHDRVSTKRSAASGASKSPQKKTRKGKAVTKQVEHDLPTPTRGPLVPEAGALPPAAAGGFALGGGWIAFPLRKAHAGTSRRPLLVLSPRRGAGVPAVNAVVDEPSFSPD